MTRAEFLARFPRATEAVIRANCCAPTPAMALCVSPAPAAKERRKPKRSRVPLTRNAGTWTEAQYWQRLRSCLRRMSIYWKPARAALIAARTPYHGPRGQKWAYLCCDCAKLYLRKNVQIDHVEPVGALTDYEHLADFIRRLLPEDPAAYAIRCRRCHQAKTNDERQAKQLTTSRIP